MAQATDLNLENHVSLSESPAAAPSGPDARLQAMLKHCSPATFEAARQFRQTGRPEHLLAALRGIIEHYVEPELRIRFRNAGDELRLVEDLGLDSLTLMQAVMKAEEALPISISDEELRHFRTLGDIRQFVARQLAVEGPPSVAPSTAPAAAPASSPAG